MRILAHRLGESVARSSEPAELQRNIRYALRLLGQIQEQTNPLAVSDGLFGHKPIDEATGKVPDSTDVWAHRDIHEAFSKGDKYERRQVIEQDELAACVFDYLRQPWSDCVELERLMLDAMVYVEVDGFGTTIRTGGFGITPSWKWNAFKAVRRWSWLLLSSGLCGMGIGGLWGFWPGVVTFAVVYQLTSIAYSTGDNRLNAERMRIVQLLGDMQSFYSNLWRSDLCPAALWETYSGMVSKGAVFHPAVPALIQHAIKRNPVIWGGR
ncbi:MAG: hypothetical protein WA190_10190 [Usitatibacter sp.]